jgi:hypothetical protein
VITCRQDARRDRTPKMKYTYATRGKKIKEDVEVNGKASAKSEPRNWFLSTQPHKKKKKKK